MDIDILKKAGLSESQAKAYIALIERSDATPAQLAETIGESRTNTYAIIDKLLKYGLISKKEDVKYGAKYIANHPSTVESLAERRRKGMAQNEKAVKDNINGLIDYFYKHTELPGTRTLQGIEGIKEVFADIIRTEQDVYFLRTSEEVQSLPSEFYIKHRQDRAKHGMKTHALTPVSDRAIRNSTNGIDEKYNFLRTFYDSDGYKAPAEIQVYGDKVAFIAYGDTQMATLINSPPIALAMKQILIMLSRQLTIYSDNIKRNRSVN